MQDTADFTLYFPRHTMTKSWLSDILFFLWEHGMHYTNELHAVATQWEEVLTSPAWEIGHNTARALQEAIDSISNNGYGYLNIHDFRVTLTTSFDPDLVGVAKFGGDIAQRKFGIIAISLSRQYTTNNKDDSDGSNDFSQLPMNEQIFTTFKHWFLRLCQKISPVYGIGYYNNADVRIADVEDITVDIDSQLQEGKIPDVKHLLYGEKLVYVAPNLATANAGILEAWRYDPNTWLHYQPDGGIMKVQHADTYEFREVQYFFYIAQQAADNHKMQESIAAYHQAWRIAQANSSSHEAGLWQVKLRSLAEHICKVAPNVSLPTLQLPK